MTALYKISTNTIIENYGNIHPPFISVPGICNAHNPEKDWSYGDYKLIEVIYKDEREGLSTEYNLINDIVFENNNHKLLIRIQDSL